MMKQTESKLNKVQRAATKTLILDEYRAHRRDNDPKARNTQILSSIRQSTYKALERQGMLVRRNDSSVMDFTDTGRKAAIDLLHESAFEEMADAFEYRQQEAERKAKQVALQKRIANTYGLELVEIDVRPSYRAYNETHHTIEFVQESKDSRTGYVGSEALISIDYSPHDGYYIDTRSTKIKDHEAKQYHKLFGIAIGVIDEILNAPDEPEPTAPGTVLTDKQAEVLADFKHNPTDPRYGFWLKSKPSLDCLIKLKYICDDGILCYITNAGRAALKAHEETQSTSPRCSCGKTESLTEVRATPESTYHLCQECLVNEMET